MFLKYVVWYILMLIHMTCDRKAGDLEQKVCFSVQYEFEQWRSHALSDFSSRKQCTNDLKLMTFEEWHLSDSLLLSSALPVDPERKNFVRQVRNSTFSLVDPTPLKTDVHLIAVSQDVLENLLDLNVRDCENSKDFLDFVSGNKVMKGSLPMAHRYGGHQFGSWASQLGDGRAHLLGEYVNMKGKRWELQLKGSGKTPYSRRGDGRAVLRSSVREFLCSEALYFLGIPTSRAASLVVSNDPVLRDQFYNGTVRKERAAVVLRVAPSWFRIGSLEILESNFEIPLLRQLVDFIIESHFRDEVDPTSPDKYVTFYHSVFNKTIDSVAKWMAVGFTHGVCNTDNYSLLGLTIDFGPFGFVEEYDENFIPNTSDDEGRYSLGNQATIAMYNLDKLRTAISPILTKQSRREIKKIFDTFDDKYEKMINIQFRKKLGLQNNLENDGLMIGSLFYLMQETKPDFTMTFRQFSELPIEKFYLNSIPKSFWALKDLSMHHLFPKWLESYRLRLLKNPSSFSDKDRMAKMKAVNPRYVLKNWMAEQAIRKANVNDFSEVKMLLKILKNPFKKQSVAEKAGYANRRPLWADDIRVSCSS